MNEAHEIEQTDIDTKLKEADAYRDMGLLNESLQIYEELLSVPFKLDPDLKKDLTEKIKLVKEGIEVLEQDDDELSAQAVSQLKETWAPGEETTAEILASASSLKELGLVKDAAEEYTKLLDHDVPVLDIITNLTECLFKIHPPSRVIDQVEKIIEEKGLDDPEKAEIKFNLGQEMENQEEFELATELFEAVGKIDPKYEGLKPKLESIQSKRGYDSRYAYLLESKTVTTNQLQNALALSKKSDKSVESVMIEQNMASMKEIGKSLSYFYKCDFVSYNPDMPIPYELLTKLKKSFLVQNSWVPMSWDMSTGIVEIVVDDPGDLVKTDHIAVLMKTSKINYSVGVKEDIAKIISHFFDQKSDAGIVEEGEDGADALDMMPDIDFEEDEEEEDYGEDLDESSSQVVRMVDQVLISAYRKGVSDIHIEPSPLTKKAGIRFRIDGVCQDFLQVPLASAKAMLSRLKIMSGLDIAERRLPQDGKIKFKRKGVKSFELRLATLPTVGGWEDAVLRILAESGAMKFDDMGLIERNLTIAKKCIIQPYGLFLVVGPTGSGKTTTLHSALGYINKPGVKIWTAEDPVEITQLGLRQVQCQAKIGLDFARVMRAFLRADPDIIMIGEMRDEETASIGVEASLTGHLVFSTLHTNSAPETVTRLLDMGLNPLNFSDAFLAVLAQRLARRLCKKCKEAFHPTEEEIDVIKSIYGKEAFDASDLELTTETELYRTEGCDECGGTGYKGRLGIHELMEGTDEVKRMIKKEATAEELFIQAAKDGMTTLQQDGIMKTFEGITDAKEIQRVCVS